MATSGGMSSNTYKTSSFYVNWQRASYSVEGNYTDINWQAGLNITGGDQWYSNAIKIYSISINGGVVFSGGTWSNIKTKGSHQLASGSTRIYHNDNGTKAFNISISGWLYSNHNLSGSQDFELDTIPRYASITQFDVFRVDETTVGFNWNANKSCDAVQWSIDGSNWNNGNHPTTYIGGLSANTHYGVQIRVQASDSKLWTYSGWAGVDTYDYSKITEIQDFTIGGNCSVYVDNPLGRSNKVEIISNENGAVIGDYEGTHNGWLSGFNNDSQRSAQYKSIPNSQSGTYYAKITYGSVVRTKGNATYKVTGTEIPTFSKFSYKDTNSKIVAVTGNDQVLVAGYSTPRVTIKANDKMVANYSANPSKYKVVLDTLNKTVDYSTSDLNIDLGTILKSGSQRLNITAVDSRELTTDTYKDINVLEYAKPVINATATRLNNWENETTIKVSGTFTKLTVGNSDKNTITTVQYRYREAGGTWTAWKNLSCTAKDGKFTCGDVIVSLNNTKYFDIEVKAVDKLSDNTISIPLNVGQAVFFISSNKKACYINGQEILTYDIVDSW